MKSASSRATASRAARTDVALPDVFVAHAVLPDEPLAMDPARIAAGRSDWIARFTDTVLR